MTNALDRVCKIFALMALVCAVAPWGLPQSRVPQKTKRRTDFGYRLEKVREWRTAIAQHRPGTPDAAARMIGAWNLWDLKTAVDFVTQLIAQPNNFVRREFKEEKIRGSLNLTDEEAEQGNLNRILKQAALLHTDIAMLGLETGDYRDASEKEAVFLDGRVSVLPRRPHWDLACRLIESVSPVASQDPMVRQWYIATTAYLQSRRLLAYANRSIISALKKLPSDDRILFYAGVLHETYASGMTQNAQMPVFWQKANDSKESELNQARHFLQRAVKVNPGFGEAHLRLGRVMGLLGLHGQAYWELQQADQLIQDSQLSYYVALQLGCQFEMLSHPNEARDQYERAAMLYPLAQSPLLALSQLARSSDDIEGASLALQRVFDLPDRDGWEEDPWWGYDLSHVRDADYLIAGMRKSFGALPR